eukprot:11222693-Lingulodinium_polyedra.AAC.1
MLDSKDTDPWPRLLPRLASARAGGTHASFPGGLSGLARRLLGPGARLQGDGGVGVEARPAFAPCARVLPARRGS